MPAFPARTSERQSKPGWCCGRESQSRQVEIQAYYRDKLVAYKIPKQVEFRIELSKTLVGKILNRVLVKEEIKKQKAAGAAQIK